MSRATRPVLVIILAIVGAAVVATYVMRAPSSGGNSSNASFDSVSPGGGQFKGPANAKVTLVEFGDYQCPSCKFYHPVVSELLRRFPEHLRLEFHHFPLIQIHPYAMSAAMAVEAAGEQGKYWEMHDLVFEHQETWSRSSNPEPEFLSLAGRIGLNVNTFMQSMRSPELQQRVLQDVVRAREAKVDEVPYFFIKGRRVSTHEGVPGFIKAVEDEIRSGQ